MPVFAVGDVHIGNHPHHGGPKVGSMNRRCRESLAPLYEAAEMAVSDTLVVVGDLFHYSRPEAQVVMATREALQRARKTYVLVGNHDMHSTERWDHACAALESDRIEVIETPQTVPAATEGEPHALLMVPFRPGPAQEWLPKVFEEYRRELSTPPDCIRTLCIHLGISDDHTPYHLDGHDDSIPVSLLRRLCKQHNIHNVLAGNWHWAQSWDSENSGVIVQVGTLSPSRYSDDGLDNRGHVVELKGTDAIRHWTTGPRFVNVSSLDDIPSVLEEGAYARPLFVKARIPADEHAAATEMVGDQEHVFLDLEVPSDKGPTIADLEEKTAALSELPVDQVVHGCVEEVAQEVDVDPSELQAVVEECLRDAG